MRQNSAILASVPFISLARNVYWELHGGKLPQSCFHWPVYDVWRHIVNSEGRKLYRLYQNEMAPRRLEKAVIDQLRERGIAMVQIDDILPAKMFTQIQQSLEARLRAPDMHESIRAIEDGARPEAKSSKYYIVRPFGEVPVFDVSDGVVRMSLSEPMLRIACGYLGMFCRLAALDVWYNIVTAGPDVLSQRWHRDPDDRALIKTFLYLRDVSENHGPFCYVPGTHQAGPFRQKIGRLNYPASGVVESKFRPDQRQVCTGKAGTLIFCDTTGFHKGGHPTAGARLLFNAVYTTNASHSIGRGVGQFLLRGSRSHFQTPAANHALGLVGFRAPQ